MKETLNEDEGYEPADILGYIFIFIVIVSFVVLAFIYEVKEGCTINYYYTYTDLNNNKGKAIDCDKNFQPYLTCELEDNRIIQVKEYKREVENLCD